MRKEFIRGSWSRENNCTGKQKERGRVSRETRKTKTRAPTQSGGQQLEKAHWARDVQEILFCRATGNTVFRLKILVRGVGIKDPEKTSTNVADSG